MSNKISLEEKRKLSFNLSRADRSAIRKIGLSSGGRSGWSAFFADLGVIINPVGRSAWEKRADRRPPTPR
jgi:hypothetical protein